MSPYVATLNPDAIIVAAGSTDLRPESINGIYNDNVYLRPYVAKLLWPVGIGTKHVQDASYPFLIQEKYRAGYFTHYAGEGTVRSAKISHNGEEVDLCLCRTKAKFSQEGTKRTLTLDPVDIVFSNLTVKLQSIITFAEGESSIQIERRVLEMSDPTAEVTI